MRPHHRRQLMTLFAVVASLVVAAKIFKAYHRGEITQSRVRPLN